MRTSVRLAGSVAAIVLFPIVAGAQVGQVPSCV